MRIDPNNKLAGVLIPAFALRHDKDLGIGDTTSFKQAIEFCSRNKIAILQTLPINETGADNSPYNAISSVALDPALLTMSSSSVPGLKDEHLNETAAAKELTSLRSQSVHYREVKKLKLHLLELAYANFQKEGNVSEKQNFENFLKENKAWLPAYSLFRTLVHEQNDDTKWPAWPIDLQTPKAAEEWIAKSKDRERLLSNRWFFSYVQWVAFEQWREVRSYADKLNVQLMGDIPFGVSRYSADVWAQPTLFDLAWSGGAPPERFFQGDLFTEKWGQNWGIPIYNWRAHQDERFAWWRQRVCEVARVFHYFRIDHVLGFFRIYAFPWIPEHNAEFTELSDDEAKEKTGGRLPKFMPRADDTPESAKLNCSEGEAILKILIDAAGTSKIVAEDLGVVPPYVRPLLKSLGIAGFAVPMFERNDLDRSYIPKEKLEPLSLATYGTHDHLPITTYYENLVSWWHGTDGHLGWLEVQRLMQFLGLDENNPPTTFTPELHYAFLRTLLESSCWLVILTITDLLGTKQRFNEPGLSADSNWSERLDRPVYEYEHDPKFSLPIKQFADLIFETERAPQILTPAGKPA